MFISLPPHISSTYRGPSNPLPSQPASSVSRKEPKRFRTQIYGYVLTEEWIRDFAERKNLSTPDNLLDTTSNVVMKILRETRIRKPYIVKWEDDCALCIAIAHNQTPEGIQLATPEKIERVKRAMELDEEPSWHYMA